MIKLINVKKVYKGKGVDTIALNNINLEISKSEFVSIMGRSGCGKSTLLNILGFMDNFDEGEYLFNSVNTKKMKPRELANHRNKQIGFIFQAFNLINDMTALENVEVPLGYANVSSKLRRKRAQELLEKVGIGDKANNYPSQLSGGQQQRVAIARALANGPEILLADEPTGNLDSKSGNEIVSILEELNNEGRTIILVTHDNNVACIAKRKIFISDGSIVDDTVNVQ